MKVDFRTVLNAKEGRVVAARIYQEGGYERRSKWIGSFVLVINGHWAMGQLLQGRYHREVYRQTERFLAQRGCLFLMYEIKGELKVHKLRPQHELQRTARRHRELDESGRPDLSHPRLH